MPDLVPIPWQPHLYLTPRTLSYLTAASRRVGRNLYLYDRDYTRVSPAWRSFAQQLTAWTRGLAGTGPKASSPYTGQRNHMRGAAFDLRETSPSVQAACRYVGLQRDPAESWHWNDPLWRSMPIIKTRTAAASGNATPILLPIPEESDMSVMVYVKTSTTNKGKAITGKTVWLVTGLAPGTLENAFETTSGDFIAAVRAQHKLGSSVPTSDSLFARLKTANSGPLNVNVASTGTP